MKYVWILLCVFLTGVTGMSAVAQDQWVTDNEMKFKIKVPSNYSQNRMRDGSDKVLTIMSPDQNVFVRVRAMQATDRFTPDLLQQVFEQNIIQGAKRIMNEDGDLHGIPARASAYTWNVQGSDAVLATYYIIQNGFAYVVWAAVPQAQAQQYSAAADGIIDSFDLLAGGNVNGFAGMGTSTNKVTLLQARLGSGVNNDYRVVNDTRTFGPNAERINLGFSYSGNTFATPFIVKWYCRSLDRKIEEYALNTPNQNDGHGFAFITNNGTAWPRGDYAVEIWHDGKLLTTESYKIQ